MVVLRFPPVESANEDGILAVGGDLDPETLLLAYRSGIFPWPWGEDSPLVWFSPPMRGVLFFDKLHISRSLSKTVRRATFQVTVDRATPEVIRRCAEAKNRPKGPDTWITGEMISAYSQLAMRGACHSVETWSGTELIGGIYGIAIGGMFAAESMFYACPDASKLAFLSLVELLRGQGVQWMDCQQLTPNLERFGGEEISRDRFLVLLGTAITLPELVFQKP